MYVDPDPLANLVIFIVFGAALCAVLVVIAYFRGESGRNHERRHRPQGTRTAREGSLRTPEPGNPPRRAGEGVERPAMRVAVAGNTRRTEVPGTAEMINRLLYRAGRENRGVALIEATAGNEVTTAEAIVNAYNTSSPEKKIEHARPVTEAAGEYDRSWAVLDSDPDMVLLVDDGDGRNWPMIRGAETAGIGIVGPEHSRPPTGMDQFETVIDDALRHADARERAGEPPALPEPATPVAPAPETKAPAVSDGLMGFISKALERLKMTRAAETGRAAPARDGSETGPEPEPGPPETGERESVGGFVVGSRKPYDGNIEPPMQEVTGWAPAPEGSDPGNDQQEVRVVITGGYQKFGLEQALQETIRSVGDAPLVIRAAGPPGSHEPSVCDELKAWDRTRDRNTSPNVRVEVAPDPDWETDGKAAGRIRNEETVRDAHLVIGIPDSKAATAHWVMKTAREQEPPVPVEQPWMKADGSIRWKSADGTRVNLEQVAHRPPDRTGPSEEAAMRAKTIEAAMDAAEVDADPWVEAPTAPEERVAAVTVGKRTPGMPREASPARPAPAPAAAPAPVEAHAAPEERVAAVTVGKRTPGMPREAPPSRPAPAPAAAPAPTRPASARVAATRIGTRIPGAAAAARQAAHRAAPPARPAPMPAPDRPPAAATRTSARGRETAPAR